MNLQAYWHLKCEQDNRENARLVASTKPASLRFAASNLTDAQRAEIEHRSTIAEHEAAAAKPPRPQDSRARSTNPPLPT
jgi:hypothetical protein